MDVLHNPPEREIEQAVAECAILMDTDFYKLFDHVIFVTCPLHIRRGRVVKNRNMSPEDFNIRDKMQSSLVEAERKLVASNIPYTIFVNDDDTTDVEIKEMINSVILK